MLSPDLAIRHLRYTADRNESIGLHKNLDINNHSSTIHNSQKGEMTQTSINSEIPVIA